jgi:hypothetical protein
MKFNYNPIFFVTIKFKRWFYLAFLRHAFGRGKHTETDFPKRRRASLFQKNRAVSPSCPRAPARSVKPLIFVVVRSAARSQFPADTSGSKFVGDRSDTTSRTVNEGVQLLRAVGRWHPLLLLGGADCNMQRLQLDEESVALAVLPVREKRDNAMERIGRAGKSKNWEERKGRRTSVCTTVEWDQLITCYLIFWGIRSEVVSETEWRTREKASKLTCGLSV